MQAEGFLHFLIQASLLIPFILIGIAVKWIMSGRIYVGYGERYLYGRTWVHREEDPILFWSMTGVFLFLGAVYLIFTLSLLINRL